MTRACWVAIGVWIVPLALEAQSGADAGTKTSVPIVKPAIASGAATSTKAPKPAVAVTAKTPAPVKAASSPKAATAKAATTSKTSTPKAPAKVATEPPPSAAGVKPAPVADVHAKVAVPSTAHLHIDVPAGLQHWLDEDDRMRPWLDKAVGATDSCYAELRGKDPQAGGTVDFAVTMHKDARPTASVTAIPSPLKSLVLCVTSRLWSIKMPLFTGSEGARYAVKAHFAP